ncbi:MAG: hypothetical protein C4527_13240 [Candidatus Omnitrophota bacterium]|jgi:hypothetical protein|nr:MAG: hypothetical protein C4527_13240 [Candidatus Omnitrophota bacterium]
MIDPNRLLYLQEQLERLETAGKIFAYSWECCQKIEEKKDYSHRELDQIDAFTSRFARLSDLVIQKLFRLINQIDLEEEGSIRDRINLAEKKGLIQTADCFIQIRILRNEIAHEYLPDAMIQIFKKCKEYAPYLLDSIRRINEYCQKYTFNHNSNSD